MSCLDCGQQDSNPNPINSCDRLECENPCSHGPHNTPQCESLPSQISNFTSQFFGEVVKTEQNGQVVWSLPCSLDIGLPANPRGAGEGLACYFLRLFMDGITGLTGPQGVPGTNGAPGNNAYTVTLQSFPQPTLASPAIQVLTQYNPGVDLVGSYVFIDTSGWYQIDETDGAGTLFLTLVKALPSASGTIAAGKLIVPSGYPGQSIQGPQGIPGPPGQQGPPGPEPTATNGMYFPGGSGSDFSLPVAYAAVNFTSSVMQFLAVAQGTYLVTVTCVVVAQSGVGSSDGAFLQLYNTNTAALLGVEQVVTGFVNQEHRQVVLSCIVTTDAPNQTIQVNGKCSVAGNIIVQASRSSMTWVRLS